MRWPRISIVTPSYNQGQYIERTVRSVLLQRYPNLEYILMDGGSTDETVERIAPYKEGFAYFVSEPDGGQADAIAKGFARSSGEIMAYLNSDDLLAPDALQFIANFFEENPKIDWVYSHRCAIDEEDRVVRYWILPPHRNFLMRRWDYIPQETCFWRRSLFEKTGNIDRSYRFAMDYDLFVRFMNLGRGRRLNRFLAAFRDHSASKTKRLLESVGTQEMLRVRRKFMIRASVTDGFFGILLGNWVQYAGRYFAAAAHSLPGGFAGLGYDYNDLWGGLLRPDNFLPADSDGPGRFKEGWYIPLCPVTQSVPNRVLFRIKSVQEGKSEWTTVYLHSKSKVAIIGPSEEKGNTGSTGVSLRDFPANQQASVESKKSSTLRVTRWLKERTMEVICRLPCSSDRKKSVSEENRAADDILRMIRGLVSKEDAIAFLNIGGSGKQLLSELAGRTRWSLYGLDPDFKAAEAASKGYQIFGKTLFQAREIPELLRGFDLIYLGDGLERFDAPAESLRMVAILMKVGGLLAFSTPNLDSEQRKLFGSAWAHWKLEKNRFVYTKKSLTQLLRQTGFSLERLKTVSDPAMTALSVKNFDGSYESNTKLASSSGKLGRMQAEKVSRVSDLLWDRLGKGDKILAVFRRDS